VSCGYFRAMIKYLSQFHKIAGGLAWCITSCNIVADFSLLFEDVLTLNDKVTIAENIERALTEMGSPFLLQTQQIVQLDCINIFPVARWLVTKVLEVKKETGDTIRLYSESQYDKFFEDVVLNTDNSKESLDFISESLEIYTAKRQYRLKRAKRRRNMRNKRTKDVEDEKVHSVLIEYGQEHLFTTALVQRKKREEEDKEKQKKSGINIPVEEGGPTTEEQEAEQARLRAERMKKNMDQVSSESTVNVSIGQMLDRSQIETATNQIQNEMQEVQNINSQLQKDGHGEVSHERMIKDLEQKINEAKATFEEIEKTHTKGKNQLEKIQGAYNQKVEEKK